MPTTVQYPVYAQERRRPSPEEEESAFLEAIKKNPEDEAIRYSYADLLSNQGRHGEAAFFKHGRSSHDNEGRPYPFDVFDWTGIHEPNTLRYGVYFAGRNGVDKPDGGASISLVRPHSKNSKFYSARHFPMHEAQEVVKAMELQGVPHKAFEGDVYLNRVKASQDETPVRHAAYRAPKGGAVVRGTWYQGGKLIPDLEGDFANPPAPEQPVAPQYPVQPKRPSIKERLKAKVGPKPLVVSYARATPESLQALMQAVRHAPSHDATLNAALADELQTAGRHKEAELVRGGEFPRHFSIDLNNGGRIVRVRPPRLNVATRRGNAGAARFAGVSYQDLLNQLQNGRSNRIGNNRTIQAGEGGDVHVLLHGNHVVTAHPNGEYSLFTQNYHTPTTFAVHREITGESPNRVRGRTMFRGQPFVEGVRFRPNE